MGTNVVGCGAWSGLKLVCFGISCIGVVLAGLRNSGDQLVRANSERDKQGKDLVGDHSRLVYSLSPQHLYPHPVFFEPKIQFPHPFDPAYYESFMTNHLLTLSPCVDSAPHIDGENDLIHQHQLGYCTSAKKCLQTALSALLSSDQKQSSYIWELINVGSKSLRPTCLYKSSDNIMRNGICCRNKGDLLILDGSETNVPSQEPDNVKPLKKQHNVQHQTLSQGDAPGLMDRGHIFFHPGNLSDEVKEPVKPTIEGLTSIKSDSDDFDDDPPSYPWIGAHPTIPPLPTHPPSLTDKPWWTKTTTTQRPTRQTTTPQTQWWENTSRIPTSKPTQKPTKWWEKEITTGSWWTSTPRTPLWQRRTPTSIRTTTTTMPSSGLQADNYCTPSYFRDAASEYNPSYENTTERITGGGPVIPHTFPWIVVLFQGTKHVCGGSLIDETHVLTAAHCVASLSNWQMSQMRVVLGMHKLSAQEPSRQEYKIKTVIRHKDYSRSLLYNDIAILTLNGKVRFTPEVRPICLYQGSGSFAGEYGTVAGWGSLFEGGRQLHTPRKVDMLIWSNSDCRDAYGMAAPGGIVPSYLCAGKQGKDACSGDSGGPMVKRANGVWQQIGIVSWGIGCGKGHYPGVYSRISHFLPWIRKVLANY